MIRIMYEGTIHRQDQIDIMIEALYSKFRRYDYIIDALIEEANKMTKDDDISKWRDNFCLLCTPAKQDRVIREILPVYKEEEGDEITYDKNGFQSTPESRLCKVLADIVHFIWFDDDLKTDMFYSDSRKEPDINNNDWSDVQQLVKTIYAYTRTYDSKFTEEDADLIKSHMSKKDITLYRIEPYENSYYKLKKLNVGDTFNLDSERTSGIKSFTSNVNSKSMQGMRKSRNKEGTVNYCVIYETVGSVYSLDIDAVSGYAQYSLGRSGSAEWEHFVSGNFEVVDINAHDGAVWVKIKQLSIDSDEEHIRDEQVVEDISAEDFNGARLLSIEEVEKYVTMEQRCVMYPPYCIKTKKGKKSFSQWGGWFLSDRGERDKYCVQDTYYNCGVAHDYPSPGVIRKDMPQFMDGWIRPALVLYNDKFAVGDTFAFNGFGFDVISNDLALCKQGIKNTTSYHFGDKDFQAVVDKWYNTLISGEEWSPFILT